MPIEDFPPFYTRQPNEATWHEQRQQWVQSLLSRCSTNKIWIIDSRGTVIQSSTPSALQTNLFQNVSINRKLDTGTVTEIIAHMTSLSLLRKADATDELLVLWNTPGQWASILLEWTERTGQLGSILTLFEIQNVSGEPFQGINEQILKIAVDVLVKRGRAVALKEDGDVVGVKIQ